MDEAEVILNAAVAVVAMRDKTLHGVEEGSEAAVDAEELETSAADETGEAVSEEEEVVAEASAAGAEESADETSEAEDSTAEGYDEAVETRAPYGAEPDIRAQFSADPVALTEAEPFSEDELILLETGRDLRPDSVVPAPDITPTEAAVLERFREIANDEELADEFAMNQEIAELDSETETSAPAVSEDAASSESTDDEKRNASSDDAAN